MANSGSNVTIVAALIALAGTIGAALISNWDRFSGHSGNSARVEPPPQPDRVVPAASRPDQIVTSSAPSVVSIAGRWRDANFPGNGSFIEQTGTSYTFRGWGNVQGVMFESSGTGSVSGQGVTSNYVITWATGVRSNGSCTGSVVAEGNRMTSTCTDSVLGTFVTSGVRE
jgi:hypothetical protein